MKFVIHIPTVEAWRIANNFRREDIASRSGLSIGTVNKALNGEPISKGTLSALCICTGLTETDLLGKGNELRCSASERNGGVK